MRIYVNEQELNAELSQEKNLAEVYSAITDWSAEQKKFILAMMVDQEEIPVSGLGRIPVDHVERVDFYIGDEVDMVLTTLNEMDRYLDQIGGTLFEIPELGTDDVKNLKEGIHWMEQILASVSGILQLDLDKEMCPAGSMDDGEMELSVESAVHSLLNSVESVSGSMNRKDIDALLFPLRGLKYFLTALIAKLQSVRAGMEELLEELSAFEKRIPSLASEIVTINVKFNRGEDLEAFEILDNVIVELYRSLSVLFSIESRLRKEKDVRVYEMEHNGVTFRQTTENFTALLKDLSSAMEERDTVAVGDILEYELTEQLRNLIPYLFRINQLLVAVNS